jgi:hypothetical protein
MPFGMGSLANRYQGSKLLIGFIMMSGDDHGGSV